jgi:hypothetical protein
MQNDPSIYLKMPLVEVSATGWLAVAAVVIIMLFFIRRTLP